MKIHTTLDMILGEEAMVLVLSKPPSSPGRACLVPVMISKESTDLPSSQLPVVKLHVHG
jgi:hypothetical protein